MIKGDNVNLSLFKSTDEIEEYLNQYMNFENRSEYDHTELFSIPNAIINFQKTGLWSDLNGTMAIKNNNDAIIGTISYKAKSSYELIVGYRIFMNENRRHGLGSESLSLFTKYLFLTKPIERITLEISANNIPSIKTAEKCGYKHEGRLRRAYYYRGNITDMIIYGIIRADVKSN